MQSPQKLFSCSWKRVGNFSHFCSMYYKQYCLRPHTRSRSVQHCGITRPQGISRLAARSIIIMSEGKHPSPLRPKNSWVLVDPWVRQILQRVVWRWIDSYSDSTFWHLWTWWTRYSSKTWRSENDLVKIPRMVGLSDDSLKRSPFSKASTGVLM